MTQDVLLTISGLHDMVFANPEENEENEPIESFTLFVYFPEIASSACAFGLMLIAIRQSAVAS